MSSEFIQLALFSLVIASPIAYFFMDKWLQNYTYRAQISWMTFILTGIGILVITLATISFQIIKAARANPIKILRSE